MDQNIRRQRIARWSRILQYIVLAAAVILPISTFIAVMMMPPAALVSAAQVPITFAANVPIGIRLAIAALASTPALIFGFGLFALASALAAFRKGTYFTSQVFRSLRRFAIALIIGALVRFTVVPLTGILLSLGKASGSMSINLGTNEVLPLLMAAGTWMLVWILGEAAEIEAENRQFV